jgi:chromosome segregation ATPase
MPTNINSCTYNRDDFTARQVKRLNQAGEYDIRARVGKIVQQHLKYKGSEEYTLKLTKKEITFTYGDQERVLKKQASGKWKLDGAAAADFKGLDGEVAKTLKAIRGLTNNNRFRIDSSDDEDNESVVELDGSESPARNLARFDEQNKKLEQMQDEKLQLRDQLQQVRLDMEAATQHHQTKLDELNHKYINDTDELSRHLDESKKALAAAQKKEQELIDAIAERDKYLEDLQGQAQEYEKLIGQQQQELEKSQEARMKLELLLQENTHNNFELQKTLQAKEEKVAQLTQEVTQQRHSASMALAEVDQLKKQLEASKAQATGALDASQKALQTKTAELAKLQEQLKNAQISSAANEAKAAALTKQVEQLQLQAQEAQKAQKEKQTQLENHLKEAGVLQGKIAGLNSELEHRQKELQTQQQQSSQALQTAKAAAQENELMAQQLTLELQGAQGKTADVTQRLQEKEQETKQLQDKLSTAQISSGKNEAVAAALAQHIEENKKLIEQLQTQVREAQQREHNLQSQLHAFEAVSNSQQQTNKKIDAISAEIAHLHMPGSLQVKVVASPDDISQAPISASPEPINWIASLPKGEVETETSDTYKQYAAAVSHLNTALSNQYHITKIVSLKKEFESKVENLNHQIAAEQEASAKAAKQIETLNATIETKTAEMHEKTAEAHKLGEALQSQQAHNQALSEELAQAKVLSAEQTAAIEERNSRAATLTQQLAVSERALEASNSDADELQAQLDIKIAEAKDQQILLGQKEQELLTSQATVEGLTQELQTQKRENQELRAQLTEQTAGAKQLAQDKDLLQQERTALVSDLQEAKREINELQSTLAQQVEENKGLKDTKATLVESLATKTNQAAASEAALKAQIKQLQQELQQKEERIAKYYQAIQAGIIEVQKLKAENKRLKSDLGITDDTIDEQAQEIARLENRYNMF